VLAFERRVLVGAHGGVTHAAHRLGFADLGCGLVEASADVVDDRLATG
jgi:hypothetical protein